MRNRYTFPDRKSAEDAFRTEQHNAYVYQRALRAVLNKTATVHVIRVKSFDNETWTAKVIVYEMPLQRSHECVIEYCFGATYSSLATYEEFLEMCAKSRQPPSRDYAAFNEIYKEVRAFLKTHTRDYY